MRVARVLAPLLALLTVPAFAGPLSEAFDQATAFGRAGNAAARSQFTQDAARTSVPLSARV